MDFCFVVCGGLCVLLCWMFLLFFVCGVFFFGVLSVFFADEFFVSWVEWLCMFCFRVVFFCGSLFWKFTMCLTIGFWSDGLF